MSRSNLDAFNLDRSVVQFASLQDDTSDVAYWLTQPPARRIQAIEFLRETFHGHAYPAQGLERVLRVIQRP